MSVLDELQKLAAGTAKTVTQKSSDIVEAARLNIAINAEEDKIQKLQLAIGRRIYEEYACNGAIAGDAAGDVAGLCAQASILEGNARDMKSKLYSLRNVKECPKCKEVLDADMVFCYSCGHRQDEPAEYADESGAGSGDPGGAAVEPVEFVRSDGGDTGADED
ncbi:MAG: zinc ribbon domain-containing protein [Clostridiales bacterium]|jgi:hypothetical protein|nr:zinc ribbon domain-containing protein [Clostridiales bacterium]